MIPPEAEVPSSINTWGGVRARDDAQAMPGHSLCIFLCIGLWPMASLSHGFFQIFHFSQVSFFQYI